MFGNKHTKTKPQKDEWRTEICIVQSKMEHTINILVRKEHTIMHYGFLFSGSFSRETLWPNFISEQNRTFATTKTTFNILKFQFSVQ